MTGEFLLLIKRYAAWGEPRFKSSYRPAGAVSNYLHGLSPGDEVRMKHVAGNVKLPYTHPITGVEVGLSDAVEPVLASAWFQPSEPIKRSPGFKN
jgi:hypothetical protein